MKILESELNIIKSKILNGFVELLPNNLLQDFVCGHSKMIRSVFVLLYLKSLRVNLSDSIYDILAAGELLHNASLLHDDVIDDAEVRRNKTTISKILSPKISILAGDYLVSLAYEKLSKVNPACLEIFKSCLLKMVKAEIRQFILRGVKPSEQEYLEICEGKTASLFSAILEACFIELQMPIDKAKSFAEKFGICFQIKNDLDKNSSAQDVKNMIYTAKDVIGIEKTNLLIDNYKEEMLKILVSFSSSKYKEELEGLVKNL